MFSMYQLEISKSTIHNPWRVTTTQRHMKRHERTHDKVNKPTKFQWFAFKFNASSRAENRARLWTKTRYSMFRTDL